MSCRLVAAWVQCEVDHENAQVLRGGDVLSAVVPWDVAVIEDGWELAVQLNTVSLDGQAINSAEVVAHVNLRACALHNGVAPPRSIASKLNGIVHGRRSRACSSSSRSADCKHRGCAACSVC